MSQKHPRDQNQDNQEAKAKGKKIRVMVTLDQNICINCGTCEAIFPEAYQYDETTGKHKVVPPYNEWIEVDEDTFKKLKMAESACPVMCIKVHED